MVMVPLIPSSPTCSSSMSATSGSALGDRSGRSPFSPGSHHLELLFPGAMTNPEGLKLNSAVPINIIPGPGQLLCPSPAAGPAGSCHLAAAPELVRVWCFGFAARRKKLKAGCGDRRGRGRRREKPLSGLGRPVPGMRSRTSVPKQ